MNRQPNADFAALRLRYASDGTVKFDKAVLRAAGLPPELLNDQRRAHGVIVLWYETHIMQGGAVDPAAERLKAELLGLLRAEADSAVAVQEMFQAIDPSQPILDGQHRRRLIK